MWMKRLWTSVDKVVDGTLIHRWMLISAQEIHREGIFHSERKEHKKILEIFEKNKTCA